MSVIDATAPPAASTTITREDGNGHSLQRRRQQQQQDHGSATSVGAGGVTFDDLDDTDASVSIVVDGATDRTPLLTRRITYRDEEGSCNDRGVDRVVVDGQVNLVRIYEPVAITLYYYIIIYLSHGQHRPSSKKSPVGPSLPHTEIPPFLSTDSVTFTNYRVEIVRGDTVDDFIILY